MGLPPNAKKLLLALSPFIGALLLWCGLVLALGTTSPVVVVTGTSMEPTLEPGDLLIVKAVDIRELEIGDIIVFYKPGTRELIVHRVFKMKEAPDGTIIIMTKGDNVPEPDRWVISQEELVGKVIYRMPGVGKIVLFLRRNAPLSIFLIALLYGLFLSELLRRPAGGERGGQ